MNRQFSLLVSLVIGLVVSCSAITFKYNQYYHAVCDENKSCSLQEGKGNGTQHAYAMYNDDVQLDGWGKLWVHGDKTWEGWYEAGFLEGALTSKRIYQHYKSWYSHQFPNGVNSETKQFMIDNWNYATNLANGHRGEQYYDRLSQILTQVSGLTVGQQYAAADGELLTNMEILLLEAAGDLYDIVPSVTPSAFKLKIGQLTAEQFQEEYHRMVSCSAMVKVADDFSDAFVGHTTWTSYVNMLRIYKNYDLHGGDLQVSFSAKPGSIYSKDDFYVLPNKRQQMSVLETTNGILNKNLYSLVKPTTLLTWQRMQIAHSFATNGKDWVDIFTKYNSGTYCNQYMVVDMKKFIPGQGPQTGFLWITEVIPGYSPSEDVTPVFKALGNVWPSFNIPYFKSVYIMSGYQTAFETYGDSYSYDNSSRALMMRRDQASILTLTDMAAYMRKDDYLTDVYAAGDPSNAISPRRDLRAEKGSAFGGIDAKVTSFSLLTKSVNGTAVNGTMASSFAQNGPTHANMFLPPFNWLTTNYSWEVHLGQPDVFNFPFVEMNFYQN
jgi:hypothetical protein